MILDKMKFPSWKLVVSCRSYFLIRLLGPSDPNVAFGPKPQIDKIFWHFKILMEATYNSG